MKLNNPQTKLFIKQSLTDAKKKRIILIGIFIIFFLIRLYFAFTYNEPLDINDQMNYDDYARTLLQEHAFSRGGRPTAYITPLYPIFLSAIYFLFGYDPLYARIAQALLGSLVCLLIYFIAKEVFNRAVAGLAFFFMGIHYYFIRYGTHLLSENLFIFLVAFSILFLIKFCKRPCYLYAVLFGLFSSLAALTRSAYFLFPFMAIMILWIMPNFTNFAPVYKKLINFCIIMILCFIFPISIWTMRNFYLFKSFIPLNTELGTVLYSSYNPLKEKIFDTTTRDEITSIEWPKTVGEEGEYSRYLIKQTLISIKKDPTKIYKYIPLKIMYFFSVFEWIAFKALGTYNFSTGFILPLSFLGIILMLRKKYSYLGFILLFPVIYFLLLTIVVMGVPRTRLPIEPYLIIFAAFFVNYIYAHGRFKGRIASVISIWYFFNYFLYLNSDNIRKVGRLIFQNLGLW